MMQTIDKPVRRAIPNPRVSIMTTISSVRQRSVMECVMQITIHAVPSSPFSKYLTAQ